MKTIAVIFYLCSMCSAAYADGIVPPKNSGEASPSGSGSFRQQLQQCAVYGVKNGNPGGFYSLGREQSQTEICGEAMKKCTDAGYTDCKVAYFGAPQGDE
jgi:hypothetical protein